MKFASILAVVAASALAVSCTSAPTGPTAPGQEQPEPVATSNGEDPGSPETGDEQPGAGDGAAVEGQGATIVVDGQAYELTEVTACSGFPSLAPPVVGFQGETADGSVQVGASLPQAVDVVVDDQSFQVIAGAEEGALSVETSVQGDLVVGRASGTAALIDGSGPTIDFQLTVACPPPGA